MMAVNPMASHCPYDVGDILQTANATNPATRWPGTTWKAITTFLLGASETHPAGQTGGLEQVILWNGNLPHLNSGVVWDPGNGSIAGATAENSSYRLEWSGGADYPDNVPISIMPPYTSIYIWQRTA